MADFLVRLSVVEDMLGICRKTIYDLIRRGDLEAVVVGVREYRIRRSSLETYIAERAVKKMKPRKKK